MRHHPHEHVTRHLLLHNSNNRNNNSKSGDDSNSISVFECNLKNFTQFPVRKNSGLIFYDAYLIHLHLRNE